MLAPAKLTLSLRITGARADGYHLIDAEMVTIDLADVVTFGPGDGLEVSGPFAGDVPVGAGNTVARALAAIGRTARVAIDKRIPAGAGLGGGSADAAAVLRWARCDDVGLAASIGADVPFCLRGGRARVLGIGEVVRPLAHQARWFTVLVPPLHVATAAVYSQWDRMGGPAGPSGNDLEPAALAVAPELSYWRDLLGEDSGEEPRLAGSGSSWFVEGEFPGPRRFVVRTLDAVRP